MEFWWIEEVLVDCLFDNGNIGSAALGRHTWGAPNKLHSCIQTFVQRSQKVKPDEPATISAVRVKFITFGGEHGNFHMIHQHFVYKSFFSFIIATSSLYVWPKCMHW